MYKRPSRERRPLPGRLSGPISNRHFTSAVPAFPSLQTLLPTVRNPPAPNPRRAFTLAPRPANHSDSCLHCPIAWTDNAACVCYDAHSCLSRQNRVGGERHIPEVRGVGGVVGDNRGGDVVGALGVFGGHARAVGRRADADGDADDAARRGRGRRRKKQERPGGLFGPWPGGLFCLLDSDAAPHIDDAPYSHTETHIDAASHIDANRCDRSGNTVHTNRSALPPWLDSRSVLCARRHVDADQHSRSF